LLVNQERGASAIRDLTPLILPYKLKTGTVQQLVGHEGWIDSIAISPDGKWLASSSAEAPIFIWPIK
jgi:WD40 repeat protein